jgi:DNA-binding MarR family transcriptional regulator
MPSGRTSGPSVVNDIEMAMNSLRRIVLALRVWAREAEGKSGVSGAQVFVLERLAEEPGQSVTSLAERTLTSKAAVSVVVSKLVERGLVRRKPSSVDGRSVILDITAAGRRALDGAPESPAGHVIAALRRLPRSELGEITRLLERLVGELGIAAMEPRLMFDNESGDVPEASRRRRTPAGTRQS